MRTGIVAYETPTLQRECPGPGARGACPLVDARTGEPACAGQHLLLRLRVIGRPATWVIRVARPVEACPIAGSTTA